MNKQKEKEEHITHPPERDTDTLTKSNTRTSLLSTSRVQVPSCKQGKKGNRIHDSIVSDDLFLTRRKDVGPTKTATRNEKLVAESIQVFHFLSPFW